MDMQLPPHTLLSNDGLPATPVAATAVPGSSQPIYRRLAGHYLAAIQAGTLALGARMPSVRDLVRQHQVSLSTALQCLRYLEEAGWVEARPRSGYFVRVPRRAAIEPLAEPNVMAVLDPAQYVGIHEQVSDVIARRQQQLPQIDLSGMSCAPELYAVEALKMRQSRHARAANPVDGSHAV